MKRPLAVTLRLARLRAWGRLWPLWLDELAREVEDAVIRLWWRTAHARVGGFKRVAASTFGFTVALVLAELTLRMALPIPVDLGNSLFGCYDPRQPQQAVYFEQEDLGVRLLKPGFETDCYWNGYRWGHRGDHFGFRNPHDWNDVDVAILGDSFVYGHGVEEHETIASGMRSLLHAKVANLGITAGNPVNYIALLRNFAVRLQPEVIVMVFFANDLSDLPEVRNKEALARTIRTGKGRELGIYPPAQLFESAPQSPSVLEWARYEHHLLSYRTVQFYKKRLEQRLVSGATYEAGIGLGGWGLLGAGEPTNEPPKQPTNPPPKQPTNAPPQEPTNGAQNQPSPPARPPLIEGVNPLGQRYLEHITPLMASAAQQAGARLVYAFLPAYNEGSDLLDEAMPKVIATVADSNNLPFADLRPPMFDAAGKLRDDTRLEGDGHLTPIGNALVAEYLASFLRREGLVR